jgi:hypothetical protein
LNKGEAIEQVLQMIKLAGSTTHDGERDNAEAQAIRLRLQHGISDADLERAQTVDQIDSSGGLGGLFSGTFFYNDKIRLVHVAAVREEIEKGLAKIARQDLKLQVKCLVELYDDLRGLVETGSKKESYKTKAVQWHRNQAVKLLYAEELAQLKSRGYSTRPRTLHETAVLNTTFLNDLSKAQVEAIVGIKEEDWTWQEIEEQLIEAAREEGCTCQPSFQGKRSKERLDRYTRHWNPGKMVHQPGCGWKKPQPQSGNDLH